MSPTLELLDEMRGRLGMFLGTSSLTKLAAFLRGFDHAREKLGVEETDRFLAEFRDWIHVRFQDTSRSWEDTILQRSADENDAIRLFWELLDEYCKGRDGMAAASPAKDQDRPSALPNLRR